MTRTDVAACRTALAFGDLFRSPIAWTGVQHGLYVAAAYAVVFWLAAWARFAAKDVTS